MKKKIYKIFAFILCLFLSVQLWPVNIVLADEAADSIIISAVSEEETAEPLGGEDNDELFAGYVDQLFGDRLFTEDSGVFFAAARPNEEKLTDIDKLVFDALKDHVIAVAAGEKTDATFRVTAKALGLSAIRYTADDLGVADLTNDNVNAAIAEMRRLTSYDHSKVRAALINDIPYEMFWYDKTVPYNFQPSPKLPDPQNPSYDISIKRSNDMSYLCWDENAYFELPMYVSANYSADGSAGTSAPDTAKLSSARTAVQNAQAIVDRFASFTDYEKLRAYANEVCRLTSYDYSATTTTPYGDPWQIIWVFDGDASTKVVCEGYAKAFKYLCDISSFSDSDIYAALAACQVYDTGTGASKGGHMYDIVTMDNGLNYMVDLTNCDGGDYCTEKLFLKSCTGSVDNGYVPANFPSWRYAYDLTTMPNDLYSDEELTLSSSDYRTVSGNLDLQISWVPSALKGNTPITFTMTPVNGSGAIGEQVLFNGMIKPRYEYMINSIKLLTSYTDSQGQNYQPEFDGSKSGSGAKYSGKNKFEYTFVTSGTYTIDFYVMDYGTRPLRTKKVTKTITINDPDCPSIEQLAADIMADAPDTGSEYDIVLYAHDYILNHGQYDYNSGFTEDNEKIYIDNNYNTAFGSAGIWMGPSAILCRGLGICESYQRALELLLAQKGIQCERVEGRTYSNHVWSRTKIDGEWTLVDLTWDDDSATTSRYNQHLYFGITDDMMLKVHEDHQASATKPCTTYNSNYFLRSGDITAFSDSIKTKILSALEDGGVQFTVPADYNSNKYFFYTVYPLVAYYLTNTDADMIAAGVEVSFSVDETLDDSNPEKWTSQVYTCIREVSSISLVTEPTKKTYYDKEAFDPTGGKVYVVSGDGSSYIRDLSEFTIVGYDPDSVGTQTLYASLKGCTTEPFEITVSHKVVTDAAVAPTCTEKGLTEGSHCENCNTIIVAQTEISDLGGHNELGNVAHKDATCTASGITGGAYCTVCNNGKAAAEKTIAALGHSWDAGKVKTAATALAAGEKVYTCTRCKTTKSEVIPKLKATGWQKINNTWYYFNADGSMAKNEWINGYWINADGSWTYQPRGSWRQNSTGWWYEDTAGWYPVNCSQKIDGVVYMFDSRGYWIENYGKNSWLKEGGTWYYYKNGSKATGWNKVDGVWYYMNSSGAMQTGWIYLSGTWYYLKSSGAMAENEWCDGYWLNAGGAWTYQPRGSWHQNSTGWWYGDTSGWYAANCTQKIDDVVYRFDARGYWVK